MAVDDTLKRDRPAYLKRNLMELLDQTEPGPEAKPLPASPEPEFQPPPKKSDPLPRPGDKYHAHAMFMNRLGREQRLIHFVLGDFTYEGFAYHDLRRVRWLADADPGHGPVLLLRFVEAVITEVRIEGRNLEDVHYYISDGTMPWVWEQPKGFKSRDDQATVITSITFKEIEK